MFIDTFNRFFEPENVRAAARVLKAAGYDVFAPLPNDKGRPLCCGRTFLSTGLIKKASIEASRLVDTLLPFVRNNIPIVGLEPSCTLALRDEVLALISNDAAEKIAKATMTFEELLARDKPNLPLKMSTKTQIAWALSSEGFRSC